MNHLAKLAILGMMVTLMVSLSACSGDNSVTAPSPKAKPTITSAQRVRTNAADKPYVDYLKDNYAALNMQDDKDMEALERLLVAKGYSNLERIKHEITQWPKRGA